MAQPAKPTQPATTDTAKKKTRKAKPPLERAVRLILGMPIGGLARLCEALIEADVDTAEYIADKIKASIEEVDA